MDEKKLLSYVSLAAKAGRISGGEYAALNSVKDYSAKLVIIAKDTSENTAKKLKDACEYRDIPYVYAADKESLGRMTGKDIRAVLSVTDEGFAKAMLKCME